MKSFLTGLTVFGCIIVALLVYFIGGMTHVSVGNIGFVKHLDGKVSEIGQGWHWVGWGVGVQEYTTYTQSLVFSDKPSEGGKENGQWLVGTADQQEIPVNTSLTWKVDTNNATTLYQNIGGQDIDYIKNSIITPTMKNIVNRITHDYGWSDIKGAKQGEVQDKINKALATELSKVGIISGTFGFTYVGSPAGMEKAQQALAEAELAAKQAQAAQEKAKIENQTKILNAQADADAVKIGSEAMKAKAAAISEMVVQEEAVQKWNGQLPTYNGGGALPFLNLAPAAGGK
jgi:regulator of protease activity HflC (stomatin/prohibitin superfamily)